MKTELHLSCEKTQISRVGSSLFFVIVERALFNRLWWPLRHANEYRKLHFFSLFMMSAPVSVQEQHKMTAHASIYVKIVSCKGNALEEKQKQFIAKISFFPR